MLWHIWVDHVGTLHVHMLCMLIFACMCSFHVEFHMCMLFACVIFTCWVLHVHVCMCIFFPYWLLYVACTRSCYACNVDFCKHSMLESVMWPFLGIHFSTLLIYICKLINYTSVKVNCSCVIWLFSSIVMLLELF